MLIISAFYKTVLDALFPLSKAESEVLSITPEEALVKLPPAPGYEELAVDLQGAKSIFAYKDERVAKLVWNIKYKKSVRAVQIGGYALWKTLVTTTAVIVIPMPITERRRNERGYNQCELLVDEIGRLEQESGSNRLSITKDLLVRIHHTARQTLKGRQDRIESAQGIFGIDKKVLEHLIQAHPDLKQKTVVVIDDVITTGSTMYEAIETLKKAGFKKVYGLSLAH